MNRSEQFDQLIAKYLDAQRRQQAPSRGQMIARHPEYAAELNSFFDNQEALIGQAPMADPAATLPPTSGADVPDSPHFVRYFGDYELLEEVARGGMGVVFKARQVSLNRIVALKMILAGQFASPMDVQRFRQEAEAAANLDHPNILPIYEVGEHEGQQYFSMKYVEGGTLAAIRNQESGDGSQESRRNVRTLVMLLVQVARAVHFAHQRGILHRDLKPGNILIANPEVEAGRFLTPDPCPLTPFVADFGLAKRIESDTKQTQTGAIVGTPTYMAPEQARSEKTLTTGVDVYALGAILYEIITGQPPFAGPTPVDVIMQVLEKEPALPSKIRAGVDQDLATIAMKCLEKDPIRRYGSAEALADELERWQNGNPIHARPATSWEKLRKWVRREPLAATLLTCVLVAFTGALVAAVSMVWFANKYANESERRALVEGERVTEAQAAAEKQKTLTLEATGAKNEAERALYFNRIALAQQYWRNDQVKRATNLLEDCPAPLRGWEWRYLNRMMNKEVIDSPMSRDWRVAYPIKIGRRIHVSKTGHRIVLNNSDRMTRVRLWGMNDGMSEVIRDVPHIEKSIDDRRGGVIARFDKDFAASTVKYVYATVSPDGNCVATADEKNCVALELENPNGILTKRLGQLPGPVMTLSFHRDCKRLLATGGSKLKVWDIETGAELLVLDGIVAAGYLPSGKHIFAVHRPSFMYEIASVRLHAAEDGKDIREICKMTTAFFDVDATESVIAIYGQTNWTTMALQVFAIESGQELLNIAQQMSRGLVAIHPNSNLVACCDRQGQSIRIYSIDERRPVYTLRSEHSSGALQFLPDGRLLSLSDMGLVIWNARQSQEFHQLTPSPLAHQASALYLPDAQRYVTFEFTLSPNPFVSQLSLMLHSRSSGLRVYRWGDHNPVVPVSSAHISVATMSADSARIIAHDQAGVICIFDSATLKTVKKWKVNSGGIRGVAISTDGRLAATISVVPPSNRDGQTSSVSQFQVTVWDATTGNKVKDLGIVADAHSLTFNHSGDLLIVAATEFITSWNIDSGAQQFKLATGGASQTAFRFDDDRHGLFCCTGQNIYELDWKSPRLNPLVENAHIWPGANQRFAVSKDRKRAVTIGERGIKLWECGTSQEVITLPLPDGHLPISALTFGADGNQVRALLYDGTQLTWDATPLPPK